MTQSCAIQSRELLGIRVDATTYGRATEQILSWARSNESCFVCLGTVNHLMEARRSTELREAMADASLVTSDGMPLVWLLRLLGIREAVRVYGPDLMLEVLAAAERDRIPAGFYGGTPEVLEKLLANLRRRFPALNVAFAEAPPFRPLTTDEDERVSSAMKMSGAKIVFVGLGTPKQDVWMYQHRGRVPAVMLGVGAAFDFFSGAKPQAPRWMQRSGLEWLFRLLSEPKRLGPRYLSQNPRFVLLAAAQLIRVRLHGHRR